MTEHILKHESFNGFHLQLARYDPDYADEDVFFSVSEWNPHDDDYWGNDEDAMEFVALDHATAYYEVRAAALRDTPNWAAQADYDAKWGEPLTRPVDY